MPSNYLVSRRPCSSQLLVLFRATIAPNPSARAVRATEPNTVFGFHVGRNTIRDSLVLNHALDILRRADVNQAAYRLPLQGHRKRFSEDVCALESRRDVFENEVAPFMELM